MFEYKVERRYSMTEDELNDLGCRDWELVAIIERKGGFGEDDKKEYYFKRKVNVAPSN